MELEWIARQRRHHCLERRVLHDIADFVYSEALELNLFHARKRNSGRRNEDSRAGFNTFTAEQPCNGCRGVSNRVTLVGNIDGSSALARHSRRGKDNA